MPIDLERKIIQIGNSLRIAIPSEIVNKLQLKAGDVLKINTDDSKIIMWKEKKD